MKDSDLTCRSCRWSIWSGERGRLVCELPGGTGTKRCGAFEREPGTDEAEIALSDMEPA